MKTLPASLNDKSIDGVAAVPEYVFSVDASSLKPGVYNFKAGSFQKKFFITVDIDISDTVSLIRVLKNSFLGYNKNLADNGFAMFQLDIPQA